MEFKNSIYDETKNSNCEKIKKNKIVQNSNTQIMAKLKNSKGDETQRLKF